MTPKAFVGCKDCGAERDPPLPVGASPFEHRCCVCNGPLAWLRSAEHDLHPKATVEGVAARFRSVPKAKPR